jgi:hypothetical protein
MNPDPLTPSKAGLSAPARQARYARCWTRGNAAVVRERAGRGPQMVPKQGGKKRDPPCGPGERAKSCEQERLRAGTEPQLASPDRSAGSDERVRDFAQENLSSLGPDAPNALQPLADVFSSAGGAHQSRDGAVVVRDERAHHVA